MTALKYIEMPFKTLSRLLSSKQKLDVKANAPEYSLYDPGQTPASPPYEEHTFENRETATDHPTSLVRMISGSSYTSTEMSRLLESVGESPQDDIEELPKYQATPQIWDVFLRSPSSVSVVSSPSRRTHSMCPCAQCHRLR